MTSRALAKRSMPTAATTSGRSTRPNIHVVTAIEYDSIERIDLVLEQNGKVDLPFVITRGMLDEIAGWRVHAQCPDEHAADSRCLLRGPHRAWAPEPKLLDHDTAV